MADVENVHFGDEMLELVRTLLRPVDFVLTVPLLSLSASAFYGIPVKSSLSLQVIMEIYIYIYI